MGNKPKRTYVRKKVLIERKERFSISIKLSTYNTVISTQKKEGKDNRSQAIDFMCVEYKRLKDKYEPDNA